MSKDDFFCSCRSASATVFRSDVNGMLLKLKYELPKFLQISALKNERRKGLMCSTKDTNGWCMSNTFQVNFESYMICHNSSLN